MVEDNDRPGIMLAASARDLLHRYGVLVGREIVVFATDDAAYGAAADLEAAGARVTVVDPRPGVGGSATHHAQVVGTRSDSEDGVVTAVPALRASHHGNRRTGERDGHTDWKRHSAPQGR